MKENIKRKNGKTTYGIVGLGRFGLALAEELTKTGREIIAIDKSEERAREVRELTDNAMIADALDRKALAETGINNCDVVIVCVGNHIEASLLTTLNLIALGVPRVIAKASSPEHGEILKRLGAKVVYPERDMAIRLANSLESLKVLDYIQLNDKIVISKILVPEKYIGMSIIKSEIRARFNINIIGVENNGSVLDSISPTYTFRKDDIMIVSAKRENIVKFAEQVSK